MSVKSEGLIPAKVGMKVEYRGTVYEQHNEIFEIVAIRWSARFEEERFTLSRETDLAGNTCVLRDARRESFRVLG